MSENNDQPQIGDQEEDINVGAPDELNSNEQDELRDVFAILEAFHGQALNGERNAQDRIRELEIQSERSAYEMALQIVAAAIDEEGDVSAFIGDRDTATDFQGISRRARGVEIDDIVMPE